MSQDIPSTPQEDDRVDEETPLLHAPNDEPYSVFTPTQKRLIILTAALASSFSPLSANIYYPAMNSISKDLRVSPSQINLTITTYMICQGIAPMLTGSLADQAGRRPAYILCFAIYIAGNIALALQHSYPALLVLRAVQSCGSSGTVALSSAVAADIITSAERGMYMGLASLGNILAPSIGPILGGILSKYLGWQSIFWFLAITATSFFLPLLFFFPETCRGIVGNGCISPVGWNRSIWSHLHPTSATPHSTLPTPHRRIYFPNPCSSLILLFHRPVGLVLLANGVVFSSYYAVTAGVPALFHELYNLDELGIGLCFIPAGLGSLASAGVNGVLVDWNYRQTRSKAGQTVHKNQRQDITGFPIEQARLQIGLPMTVLAAVSIIGYGALISVQPPLILALLVVFVICFCITSAYNVMNVLIVDLYYETPATAMAANNLVRIGVQWTYCLVSGVIVLVLPLLGAVYLRGWAWRKRAVEIEAQREIIQDRETSYLTVLILFNDMYSPTAILPLLWPTGQFFHWPSHQLDIRYPNGPWITPGMELDIRDTNTLPEINSAALKCNKEYIILFIDLDAILPGTHIETVILHWYQAGLSKNCTQDSPLIDIPNHGSEEHPTAPYIAPRAPPNTHHRYVYLLFAQDGRKFPECFAHVIPKTIDARAGFDVREFMSAAELSPPVAMNYFVGRHEPGHGETATVPVRATTTSFRSVDCTTSLG
ncbi:uncharacterized protein N7515_008874, partial [Penicillium bovifimosum]